MDINSGLGGHGVGGSKSKPAIEIFEHYKHGRKEDCIQGNLSSIRHERNAIIVSTECKTRRWNDREVMPSLANAVVEIRKRMSSESAGACSRSCHWSPMLARFEVCCHAAKVARSIFHN